MKKRIYLLGAIASLIASSPCYATSVLNPHHYLARQTRSVNNISGISFNNVDDSNHLQVYSNPYNMYENTFITKEGWLGFDSNESSDEWLEIGAIDGFSMNSINDTYNWSNAVRWKGSFYGYNKRIGANSYKFQAQKLLDYGSSGQRNYSIVRDTNNGNWVFYVNGNQVGFATLNDTNNADDAIVGIETASQGNNFTSGTWINNWTAKVGGNWYYVTGSSNIDTNPNTWCGSSVTAGFSAGTVQFNRTCTSTPSDVLPSGASPVIPIPEPANKEVKFDLSKPAKDLNLPILDEVSARAKSEVLKDNSSKKEVLSKEVDKVANVFLSEEGKTKVKKELKDFGAVAKDNEFKDYQISDNRQVILLSSSDTSLVIDAETQDVLRVISKNVNRRLPSNTESK